MVRFALYLIKVGHNESVPVSAMRPTLSFIANVRLSLQALYLVNDGPNGLLYLA